MDKSQYLLIVCVVVSVQPAGVGPPPVAIATAAQGVVAVVGSTALVPSARTHGF